MAGSTLSGARKPRVLFLAHYFPPLGGAGAQRSAKFAKYLPELGFEPIVVTGPATATSRWAPTDEALEGDVRAGTRVVRVDGPQPQLSHAWRARAERWVGIPAPFSRWYVEETVKAARRVGREADLVYASMSPFEAAAAAARLARELRLPWVADLRDPWALDEVLVYPTAAHRRLATTRMGRALASADAIVMNTPEASAALLRRFPRLASKPVVTIPNGYDAEDFSSAPAREGSSFRIVHAGYAHTTPVARWTSVALGGALRGFDLLTRSYVHLLDAVENILRSHPEQRERVEVHLAGFVTDEERTRLAADHVHVHGYLTHPETLALLRSADLLFLPMHDLPRGRRARTVPGKTYEYMASGRPILAAVPDGDARDLLGSVGTARLCRPSDVAEMERIISDELQRTDRREAERRPDAAVLARYERRHLAERLAELFETISPRRELHRSQSTVFSAASAASR